MGSTLFSAAYAAQAAEVNRELLEKWLKTGVFETEHFAQNSKTREKLFILRRMMWPAWRNLRQKRCGRAGHRTS